MKRFLHTLFILCALVLLAQVGIGTSPATPPYHQYWVGGKITRPSGHPLGNFVITLAGKFSGPFNADTLLPASYFGFHLSGENYPALTDTAGQFSLVIATEWKADSLTVEVNAVDKPVVRGALFAVPKQIGTAITSTFVEGQPGCSGCGKDAPEYTRIDGYRYNLPSQIVVLPF